MLLATDQESARFICLVHLGYVKTGTTKGLAPVHLATRLEVTDKPVCTLARKAEEVLSHPQRIGTTVFPSLQPETFVTHSIALQGGWRYLCPQYNEEFASSPAERIAYRELKTAKLNSVHFPVTRCNFPSQTKLWPRC